MTDAHSVLFGFMDMLYGRDPDEAEEESDGFDDSGLDTDAEECEDGKEDCDGWRD